MGHWFKFVTDHWAVISPVVVLVASELLSLNPKAKSNGVIQLVMGLITPK